MIRIDDRGPVAVERRGSELSVAEIRLRIARDVELVAGSVDRVAAILAELRSLQ